MTKNACKNLKKIIEKAGSQTAVKYGYDSCLSFEWADEYPTV